MLTCCKLDSHPWDQFQVVGKWQPQILRCLIVGENPSSKNRPYFYEIPKSFDDDPVDVRRGLLQNLYIQKLLASKDLEGFRDAGFLFDHAIRCHLPSKEIRKERNRANQFASKRVEKPTHLLEALGEAPIIWVMGHVASNAVANLTTDFPKEKNRRISFPPFPGEVFPGSRYFLSSYLSGWNEEEWEPICMAFVKFSKKRGVF